MAGRTRTLTQLIADVRQTADVESAITTARHPDAQITEYLNQGIAELFDMLRASLGDEYVEKVALFPTGLNQTDYLLAAVGAQDYLSAVEVKALVNGNQISLRRMTRREESIFLSPQPGWSGFPMAYRIFGNDMMGSGSTIRILPGPMGGVSIYLYYIPTTPRLSAGSDTFDGIDGWELYPIKYAAREVCLKDEHYDLIAMLDADMAKLKDRIQGLAGKRDQVEPPRVNDVTLAGRYRWRRRRWLV